MMILVSAIYLAVSVLLVIDHSFPIIPPEGRLLTAPILAALGVLLLITAIRSHRAQKNAPAAAAEKPDQSLIIEQLAMLKQELAQLKADQTAAAASEPATSKTVESKPAESYESAVALLAVLQEKGRLIDFLMEPIEGAAEGQLAAAARVVHQGCREVLADWIKVAPIFSGAEGQPTVLERGYSPEQYRVIGNIKGEPPFEGTVLHRGWKIEQISLPRAASTGGGSAGLQLQPVIAPAEVEIKQ